MKARESGMPEEDYWSTFFDADCAITKLFGGKVEGDVVEFGCGYGTFTLSAARHASGTVLALDIESELISRLDQKAAENGILNVRAETRDFVAHGTGPEAETQSHAMIYNLLHLENPIELLQEAYRVLRPGGTVSIIHWRSDIPTPRGPSLEIRPTPQQCKAWLEMAGFHAIRDVGLQSCCPFHFGIVATR